MAKQYRVFTIRGRAGATFGEHCCVRTDMDGNIYLLFKETTIPKINRKRRTGEVRALFKLSN